MTEQMVAFAPPQDMAAEQAALGAMLISSVTIPDITELLTGRDFYRPSHETIFAAIMALYHRREPVDSVTVANELDRQGELQRIGGATYLHDLTSSVPSPSQGLFYAAIVLDKALRRRIIEASHQVQQRALDAADATQAAQDARQLMDAASQEARTVDGGVTVADGLDAAIDWLEKGDVGVGSPWPDLNRVTNGLLDGQMITVAGRPGHGKSIVAKDVAIHMAKKGIPVHIATLEMSRNDYLARILSTEAKVDIGRLLRRECDDREWERVRAAYSKVRDLPIYLDDRPHQSMAQIRAAARQTQRRFGSLGFIAIDYAQLVQPDLPGDKVSREQQVAQISRDTKLLAKEFECPTMLLAQLNRGNTQRANHVPMVSDLRESGSLEQDSDQVWLLHRADQYGDGERPGEVDLIVGKNRNGPAPSTVSLSFMGHYFTISSMAQDYAY